MSSKTVLITGTSGGGIGAALALAFHEKNYHVFLTARTTSKIPSSLTSLPHTTVIPLDVTSASSIASALAVVKEQVGDRGLDALVNNAGNGYVMPLLDTDLEKAKALFEVNFWGTVATTQAFAPLLIEAKGAVVSTSSLLGENSMPYRGIYAASKSATQSLGETLRMELAPFGVRSITTVTGLVRTNFGTNVPEFDMPNKSLYRPIYEEVKADANEVNMPKMTDAHVYARKVVADVVGGANGVVHRGNLSTIMNFVSRFAPVWVTNYVFVPGTGLDKLAKMLKDNKRT